MKCLIIAAGQGTRLSGVGDSKPLVPLLGKPLILHVIQQACRGGVDEFYVVIGYNGDKIKKVLSAYSHETGVVIHFIENDEWWKQNGLSVLKARDILTEPFYLLMSDHMFESSILVKLKDHSLAHADKHSVVLAVDSKLENNPFVDLEDVTKVLHKDGDIIEIGKTISQYNAFDTGIFYCNPKIFSALAKSVEAGDSSLSGGILMLANQKKAGTMDIGDASWIDVDNEEMLNKATEVAEKIF